VRRVYKNMCLATISASIMAANIWRNSLKNVESDNNKILYETLLDFFLQRNGIYFLNKPRTNLFSMPRMVTRMLLSVVIYVHSLSCIKLQYVNINTRCTFPAPNV